MNQNHAVTVMSDIFTIIPVIVCVLLVIWHCYSTKITANYDIARVVELNSFSTRIKNGDFDDDEDENSLTTYLLMETGNERANTKKSE